MKLAAAISSNAPHPPPNTVCAQFAIPRGLLKSAYLINRQCDDQRLVVALANDSPLCHSCDISLLHQPDDHISSVQKDACSPGTDVITWLCAELDECTSSTQEEPCKQAADTLQHRIALCVWQKQANQMWQAKTV